MDNTSRAPLPPIERTVSVSWAPDAAFKRFTTDVMTWWPYRTHSIGGPRVKRVVFEGRVGGMFFEELVDGRRFQWGELLAWDPPRSVTFTFHPSRDPSEAQEVTLRFIPEGTGTRLTLTADKWERVGKRASIARRGYESGWGYVLNVWAGRRTPRMAVMDAMMTVINAGQLVWYRGRGGMINAAKGELR
ncbi:MAG TPA: SRPBCC domain-containing protein [Gemmatimonadaceae bacterium]|nr:SRPBCC domain-containing protein [Gemmatimonadaceae bacterium]